MADDYPSTRVCRGCKRVKPLTDFGRKTGGKFGRKSRCRDCERPVHRAYRRKVSAKTSAKRKATRAANPEAERQKLRAYRVANPDKTRRWDRTYREKNREKRNADSRSYYDANREREIGRSRAWQIANPERFGVNVRKNNAVRKSRKRASGGRMTRKEWDAILDYFGYHCAYCLKHENEVGRLEIDHMLPISRGGTAWPENSVPACRTCNASKLHRTPMEFLSRQCDRALVLAAA